MDWLTQELAQEIVDKMIRDIPYSINIMNEKGIIIGSGDKKRVGTLHQGAVQAIESGRMVEIYRDDRNVRKGTNEPIVIGRQLVGVVGITGDPEEVRPFCRVVKTAVSLLIEQGIAIGNREAELKRKEIFLETLLNEKRGYSQEMVQEAERYQLNLHVGTTVVLIKNWEAAKAGHQLLEAFPFFKKENGNISIVLIQNAAETEKLIDQILRLDGQCLISAGGHMPNVADSYRQAFLSLRAAENLGLPGRCFRYEKLRFIAELSEFDTMQTASGEQNKNISLPDALLDTLKTYVNHNANPTTASQSLMIHRNTLYYRLERIKQLTGKDPDQLLDLFELAYFLLRK